jgi:hypothetical protein
VTGVFKFWVLLRPYPLSMFITYRNPVGHLCPTVLRREEIQSYKVLLSLVGYAHYSWVALAYRGERVATVGSFSFGTPI